MSLQRTKNTEAEMRLRRVLHRRGLRYRLGRQPVAEVQCKPDLVFVTARVAVFVDGCFWHGCKEHPSWPKSNAQWWKEKIERNRQRDEETRTQLRKAGWSVVQVWEHEDVEHAADRVMESVRSGRVSADDHAQPAAAR
jgi:DNA mismatch endonuclease (patch repair protein)